MWQLDVCIHAGCAWRDTSMAQCLCLLQVAVWLVWKSRVDKQELALPLTIFGASLALGNYWNGVIMCFVSLLCTSVAASQSGVP